MTHDVKQQRTYKLILAAAHAAHQLCCCAHASVRLQLIPSRLALTLRLLLLYS
jgi:hypothetical protein